MNRQPEKDIWFQRVHRWRLRNSGAIYLALLCLVALASFLRYWKSN